MRTELIAEMINRQQLHIRKDGQPVTSNKVYAVICRYPDMFVKACANEWNAKLALVFRNECSQGSPKAAGRRTDYVDDMKKIYLCSRIK